MIGGGKAVSRMGCTLVITGGGGTTRSCRPVTAGITGP
jgi:hypothetical protein